MIHVLADNITSPLGFDTAENLRQVSLGRSAIARHEGKWDLPEAFAASLFSPAQWEQLHLPGHSPFEALVVRSIREALTHTAADVVAGRTCFILSTTKANIEALQSGTPADILPAEAARHIADSLGLKATPIVVCNACISGVTAQVLAVQMLESGQYDYAIVAGCDVQSKFIVSGFQSLKAVSDAPCRPFDLERRGLNLGEAAATIILAAGQPAEGEWVYEGGAMSNDGLHITNPSPKGTGSAAALTKALGDLDKRDITFINVHGTATLYNDQMESKAIEAAGLADVPVNALKGYYGHTMGAAGILETILSLHAADSGTVPASRGFEEAGVSGKVRIAGHPQPAKGHHVVKLISGFGGCNGAVVYGKYPQAADTRCLPPATAPRAEHRVRILPGQLCVDGVRQPLPTTEGKMLTQLYKACVGDYPKFYKMDLLGKLGFLAAELLLQCSEGADRFCECDDTAVVLFNHSSSIMADREYLSSIADAENFFPSPSVFVYTLPNIVTGEIAIRNHYHGATALYILPDKDEALMQQIVDAAFRDGHTRRMIAGWVDAMDEENFEADLQLLTLPQ